MRFYSGAQQLVLQIYNQSSLVADLIMRLKGLKMSQNPRDQRVLLFFSGIFQNQVIYSLITGACLCCEKSVRGVQILPRIPGT